MKETSGGGELKDLAVPKLTSPQSIIEPRPCLKVNLNGGGRSGNFEAPFRGEN